MLKIKVWVLEKHTYQYHNQQGSSVLCYPSISISTIHTSIAYLHIHTSILHGSALSASKSYVRSEVWSKYLWVYISCHWTHADSKSSYFLQKMLILFKRCPLSLGTWYMVGLGKQIKAIPKSSSFWYLPHFPSRIKESFTQGK